MKVEIYVAIINALKWPVVVVLCIFILRESIGYFIRKLTGLKIKWKDFIAELSRAEELAEKVAHNTTQSLPEQVSQIARTELESLRLIASESPRAAIMEAWRRVELETQQVAHRHGITLKGRIVGIQIFHELMYNKIVNADIQGIYNSIRRLRNEVAHADDFNLSYEESIRYVELAIWLVDTLRKIK